MSAGNRNVPENVENGLKRKFEGLEMKQEYPATFFESFYDQFASENKDGSWTFSEEIVHSVNNEVKK